MVKSVKKLFLSVALLSMSNLCWAGSDRAATIDRLDHAGKVLGEIMSAPDKGIPEEVLEHAKCVAVVPHMIKGGLVFGALGAATHQQNCDQEYTHGGAAIPRSYAMIKQ